MGFGWPCATGTFCLAATHFVKSGGSGTAAVPPGCAWPLAAVFSHLSNSSWLIVESPTLATAPVGTSFPQPANAAAPTPASAKPVSDLMGSVDHPRHV